MIDKLTDDESIRVKQLPEQDLWILEVGESTREGSMICFDERLKAENKLHQILSNQKVVERLIFFINDAYFEQKYGEVGLEILKQLNSILESVKKEDKLTE